ncbi:hypothetical protein D3C75_1171100 [compost metagenome]
MGVEQHRGGLAGQTAHKVAAVAAYLIRQTLLFEQDRKGGRAVVAHQYYGWEQPSCQQILGQMDDVNFNSTDLTRIDGQPDLMHG